MGINVVDSIMGSGKSSWAINYMNNHPQMRFIYIAQFLEEAHRIVENCPQLFFCEPHESPSKQYNFKLLLQGNRNIATTHSLFSQLILSDDEIEEIRDKHYTIFIDETVETIDVFKISKGDVQNLFDAGLIEREASGSVKITERGMMREENKYKEVLSYISAGSVFIHNEVCLMWILPPKLFQLSENFFILTYLFDASHMKHTLKMYGYEYEIFHIEKPGNEYQLVSGTMNFKTQKGQIKALIDLYDGDMNELGAGEHNLGHASWERKGREQRQKIANAARRYFRRWATGDALHVNDCMWSVYKDFKDKISVRDYDRAWCAYNLRATNKYRDCFALAYLVNVHEHPTITDWFRDNGEILNGELYSLSVMIQWIWRSSIREGRGIKLFLPSERMRNMLTEWYGD